MSRRLISMLLAALLMLCMACAAAESASVTVKDMYGREVTLAEPTDRIVALTASDCEILCALGAEDALVGRGEYCDYPESILALPVVQSGADTNIEEILALNPQVVLMGDMAQSKEIVDMLEANGIRVAVSNAESIEGVYTAVRMIGALMGRDSEAETLVCDMQAAFDGIASQAQDAGKTVYFEVSPLQYGLWTAGSNTFMDELAAVCGLTNAFADVQGWAAISEEQVLMRDPDYIVTISMYFGEGPTPVEEILSRNGWESLRAVQRGNVLKVDSDSVSRPGPRLKDAALELFDFIQQGTAEENLPA